MRRWLRILSGPALVVAAALVIGLVMGPAPRKTSFDPGSADPGGARALAVYLSQSGWRVRAQVEDPAEIPAQDGVLLVPAEVRSTMSADDGRRLLNWVREGGLAVLLGPPSGLGSFAGSEPLGGLDSPGDSGLDPALAQIDLPPPTRRAPAAGTLEVRAVGSDFSGVQAVAAGDGLRWDLAAPGGQAWRSLLSDPYGSLVAVRGESDRGGEIRSFANPSVLTNDLLGRADDLGLALALVQADRRQALGVFTGDPLAPLRLQLAAGQAPTLPLSWRLAGWGLVIAALLAFWLSGRRTGPVLRSEPPAARPATEFVLAQAHAYRRARATHAVLRYAAEAFRRDLARRSGLPARASLGALAAAGPRFGLEPAELGTLLRKTELALAGPLSEKGMVRLVRDLIGMHRRIANARH